MNKLKKSISGVALVIIGAGLIYFGAISKDQQTVVRVKTASIDRCSSEKGLFLQAGVNGVKSPIEWAELMNSAQVVKLKQGRHKDAEAVTLLSIKESIAVGGRVLEIQPCTGNNQLLYVNELDTNPERFVLIPNKRGELKLMDQQSGSKKALLKGIHLIRLLD